MEKEKEQEKGKKRERLFILRNKASINIILPDGKRLKKKKGDTIKTKSDKMAQFLLSHWFIEVKTDQNTDQESENEGDK